MSMRGDPVAQMQEFYGRQLAQATDALAEVGRERNALRAENTALSRELEAARECHIEQRQRAKSAEAEVKQLLKDGEATISLIMDDIVNLEYINCDESNPDLCHATRDELSIILRRHILGEE